MNISTNHEHSKEKGIGESKRITFHAFKLKLKTAFLLNIRTTLV